MTEPVEYLNLDSAPNYVKPKKGCDVPQCFDEGTHHPVLVLRTKSSPVKVRAVIAICVCEKHRAEVKLSDVLTESGWLTILQGFIAAKKAAPKRSLTELDWTERGSAEADAWLHAFT